MVKFLDRAKMSVSGSPGTGDVTLNAAAPGFQSFATAGASDGDRISYVIEEVGGLYEFGVGTYVASGPSLTRDAVYGSSDGGAKVGFSAQAVVYASVSAADLRTLPQRYEAADFPLSTHARYLLDTSGGSFTATLPADPETGAVFTLVDARSTWAANPVTVARNGQTIAGLAENLTLDVDGAELTLLFAGGDWRLV